MNERTPAAPAIEVRNVVKRFGDVIALDRVTFSVLAGEMFFLLGPSGCGKTTMLRILAGLETPDSGTVLFDGQDIASLPPHRRNAPMVFQNYALWPHLSVKDNVSFGLVERGLPSREIRSRTGEALRRVGLADLAERMPAQLSGGQQQRVVVARALVLDPRIVLLDEPLSNLDVKLRHEMRDDIEKLHRETDIAFVYVTHDQSEALSLADRMAVMREGAIEAVGTPPDLYHRPRSLFCADFLGEANLVSARIVSVSGGVASLETPFGPWRASLPDGVPAPAAGSGVHCIVRPENVGRTGAPGWNTFRAGIVSARMSGPTISIRLDADGVPMKAVCLNEHAAVLNPGAEREWHIDPGNAVVIV